MAPQCGQCEKQTGGVDVKTIRELVKSAFVFVFTGNKIKKWDAFLKESWEQFVKEYPEMNNDILDTDAGMRLCEDDHDPVWFEGDYCPICEMRISFEENE